ncbi:hypothetical protein PTTG_05006 [Puccinia triticina 1-1 BBBD Race 1]|uniref:RNI-like protein n=1 Tax=Puccinia triticina (isolate 1-1 / race 1 (BBBD)) TaxID=630390 RepID=A0A180GKW8_PUCT1|nr:hypothetical protein PTTG_05006 [Puccinia triticina 1-1 BBBD Race 1]
MSSLFPLLRSLLISPLKPAQEDRRGPASIHHVIQDRDRGGFTTPDRQQDHLSFHDTGLRGPQGALIVLEALATNPFASTLTLSHNALGDAGVRQLASRLRFLKKRRTTPIHELNLASNSLTDAALAELCRAWDGLVELYLSNNLITLNSSPSPLLAGLGNLTLLSLTSNPIDCSALSSLLRNPNLSLLQLTTLHLSACSLDLSVAVSLALWLEDRSRSGPLEWLAVNGNNWGTRGCERIVWALARCGGNSSLLRVEMLACDAPRSSEPENQLGADDQDQAELIKLMGFKDSVDREDCRLTIELEGGWKNLLEKCESRNQALRLATRRAALGLISTARPILLSTPAPESALGPVRAKEVFPWDRLPEELKLNIWRWVAILSAFPGLQGSPPRADPSNGPSIELDNTVQFRQSPSTFVDPLISRGTPAEHPPHPFILPDPLTPSQLLSVINYAQDRECLQAEIGLREEAIFSHLLSSKASSSSSVHRQLVDTIRRDADIDRQGRAFILNACGCLRFQGTI